MAGCGNLAMHFDKFNRTKSFRQRLEKPVFSQFGKHVSSSPCCLNRLGAESPHHIPGELKCRSGEDTSHADAGIKDTALLARRIVY